MADFLRITCNKESVGMLLTLTFETCSTDQWHKTGRLKHTHTKENVITVDEMVGLLNHKGQISKDTDLTKFSIVQTIYSIFGWKCNVYFVHQHACCLLLLVFLAFVFHKVV